MNHLTTDRPGPARSGAEQARTRARSRRRGRRRRCLGVDVEQRARDLGFDPRSARMNAITNSSGIPTGVTSADAQAPSGDQPVNQISPSGKPSSTYASRL